MRRRNFIWLDRKKFIEQKRSVDCCKVIWSKGKVHLWIVLEWFNFRMFFSVDLFFPLRTHKLFLPLLVISVNILLLIDFLNYIAQLFTCLLPFVYPSVRLFSYQCVHASEQSRRTLNWKQSSRETIFMIIKSSGNELRKYLLLFFLFVIIDKTKHIRDMQNKYSR